MTKLGFHCRSDLEPENRKRSPYRDWQGSAQTSQARRFASGLGARLQRLARASIAAGVVFLCLCGAQLSASLYVEDNLNHQDTPAVIAWLDSRAFAQNSGNGDRRSKRRRFGESRQSRDRNDELGEIRRDSRTGQSSRAQRDLAMEEVKRRFPDARVLKLNPVGDSVFRARVLTPGGKVKVINVRAREF